MNYCVALSFHKLRRGLFPAVLLSSLMLLSAQAAPVGELRQLSSPDQTPEGLSKSDWSSIRSAYDAGRHAFQPVDGGWQAHNPGQQWTTSFDRRGFVAEPEGGGWLWGLELKSYGFDAEQIAIGGTPEVKAEGQRFSYQWDGSMQEWFVNDKRGLEHGFTIGKRPARIFSPNSQSSTLDLLLSTRGTLRPIIIADAQGVHFQDASGATVLNYTGLKVWDADGNILRSRFEAAGETDLRLRVEESDARYPLTIDPIAQQAFLKASNTGADDQFGYSVAVSGDTVVVGALYEDSGSTGVNSTPDESAPNAGAAFVFVRTGPTWTQQAYLKASNPGMSDWFGFSVAVSGDTVVVGAIEEDSSVNGVNGTPNEIFQASGAAYVFVRSTGAWSQQAFLKASNTGQNAEFGFSVAVSGDTVAIGARNERSTTTGVNSTPDDFFTNPGAAYVFVRSGTTWSQEAYLKASNTGAQDQFGSSVAVSGNSVVVGAPYEDSGTTGVNSISDESLSDAGAGYVFVRSGATWSQQAYLKAGNPGANDQFGYSLAVSGDAVVVGAWNEDSNTTGVNSTPNETAADSGAAYAFVRSGTTWTQQAYLKAGNTGAGDGFGISVAVSSDTVAVGAYGERSGTTGVNSTPNESASYSGAAYAFTRSGTVWSQQAYLKSSNTGVGDNFGKSVALSGDTMVVGAIGEGSGTTGVNSTPNELAPGSGAAYIFTGLGPAATFAPIVQSPTSTGITLTGVTLGGNVTDSGSQNVTERGIVYSQTPTNANPVIGGTGVTKVIVNGTTGVFTTDVTGLASGTNYSFKAYAISGVGIGYSALGSFTTLVTDISVEYPVETSLTSGVSSISFGEQPVGLGMSGKFVVIFNTGTTPLTIGTVSVTGSNAGDFSVTQPVALSLPTNGSGTSFYISFVATVSGARGTTLRITSDDPDESPFDITLTGTGISYTADTDGDGMNDAAELLLSTLGFNRQMNQSALVNTYYTNANAANLYSKTQYDANFTAGRNTGQIDVLDQPNSYGLYTTSQVQALNVGVPLLVKNPSTGKFKLTMGVQKSNNLSTPFAAFPMNTVGTNTTINAAGKLEFEFTSPDNAAFFRIESK